MKKIEQEIYQTIKQQQDFYKANTLIRFKNQQFIIALHGNVITEYESGKLYLNDCGYPTRLTTSRLNTILQALGLNIKVSVKNFRTQYLLNGQLLGENAIEIPYYL